MTTPTLPPSHITLELEDKEIREDISKIIEAMSRIRTEALEARTLAKKEADEYLHLTYRLASGVRAIATPSILEKMQLVANAIDKNNALLSYDPRQDGYWQRGERKFVNTLDELLISLAGENFSTIDAKHHLLQAVKFLGVSNEPFKEKARVYDTITPFGNSPLPKEGLVRRILGAFFGSRYNVESVDDLTLNAAGDVRDLAHLMREAAGLGYERVRMKIPSQEFERLTKANAFPIQALGTEPTEPIVETPLSRLKRKGLDKLITYTMPISYPILGFVPFGLNNRLLNYTKPNQSSHSKESHLIGMWVPSIGLELAGGLVMLVYGIAAQNLIISIPGFSSFIDAVVRLGLGISKEEPCGSFPFWIALMPLERYLGKKEKRKTEGIVNAEFRVGKGFNNKKVAHQNPVGYLEQVAQIEVPEDVEKNLVWGTDNHNNFGEDFVRYAAQLKAANKGLEIETLVDKENRAVIYCHSQPIDGYRKSSSLFCFKGKRYLVTTISPEAPGTRNGVSENGVSDIERTASILADGSGDKEKAERLGNGSDVVYLRVRKYEAGKVTEDLEGPA